MNRLSIRFRIICLVFVGLVSTTIMPQVASAAASSEPVIQVYVDGKQLQMEVLPVIEQGCTLVPLRAIFEALGATVEWNATEQSITALKGDLILKMTIGSNVAIRNGVQVSLDVPPKVVNNRTLVPLRFIGESLGSQVTWDAATNSVEITPTAEYFLNIPGENWALAFNSDGFKIEQREAYSDLSGCMILATNDTNGLVLSIYLEKEINTGDSKDCRDFYMKKLVAAGVINRDELKLKEVGNMAIMENLYEKADGLTVNQQNVHAYMAYEDTYIDIHLSKVLYESEDQKLFDDFLSQVRIAENYYVSSEEFLAVGSFYYLLNDYEKAIYYYEKALEIEKKNRSIELNKWRVLVDNLGMAYGITGELEKSKEVYKYAIAIDSIYPNFYYSLACTYAESNDMKGALTNLELAYKYKENIIPGETFPDPQKDSSFAQFMNDEEFIKELTRMGY